MTQARDAIFDAIFILSDAALEVNLPRLARALEDNLDIWLEECGKGDVPDVVFVSSRAAERDWITHPAEREGASERWPSLLDGHRKKIWASNRMQARRESKLAASRSLGTRQCGTYHR